MRVLSGLSPQQELKWTRRAVYGCTGVVLIAALVLGVLHDLGYTFEVTANVLIPGMLLSALAGVVLVEQVYRNTSASREWSVKFLWIGAGALFAYDLCLYSVTLLFRAMPFAMWEARGAANALAVPLLAVGHCAHGAVDAAGLHVAASGVLHDQYHRGRAVPAGDRDRGLLHPHVRRLAGAAPRRWCSCSAQRCCWCSYSSRVRRARGCASSSRSTFCRTSTTIASSGCASRALSSTGDAGARAERASPRWRRSSTATRAVSGSLRTSGRVQCRAAAISRARTRRRSPRR